MDLADIKICKTLIINVFYFANSLNSYEFNSLNRNRLDFILPYIF